MSLEVSHVKTGKNLGFSKKGLKKSLPFYKFFKWTDGNLFWRY